MKKAIINYFQKINFLKALIVLFFLQLLLLVPLISTGGCSQGYIKEIIDFTKPEGVNISVMPVEACRTSFSITNRTDGLELIGIEITGGNFHVNRCFYRESDFYLGSPDRGVESLDGCPRIEFKKEASYSYRISNHASWKIYTNKGVVGGKNLPGTQTVYLVIYTLFDINLVLMACVSVISLLKFIAGKVKKSKNGKDDQDN